MPPGAATPLEFIPAGPTPGGGTQFKLRTQLPVGGDLQFNFEVRPGTTLGGARPTLSVAAGNGTPEAATTLVDVQETFEPNDDPASAPVIAPGTLYLSYLTSAADTDFFRVNVPSTGGTRSTIRLSHLPEDYDLVVYGPQGVQPLVAPGDAPPLETPVLGDAGAPITHLTDALPAETLDDLTLLSDRPVLGVSAFRTTEDEAVVAISDGAPGAYIVQITGYNGASSAEPYVLRVETEAPRQAPACQPRLSGLSFGTATGVNVGAIPAGTDTLFLANGPQLAAAGGQGVVGWFSMAHLDELRLDGHPSALVRLEDDPAVRAAYTAWNAQPCSTARANAVVRAITDVVRTIRAARPSARNVVLLGNDTALPFARLEDLTTIANEADYASTFSRSDDLYGALFEHRVLSDDPYATTDPIPYLQRQLFVPQLAVGRLVESGTQITGALDRFLAFDGVLDPTSARTSGYDFLRDGANGVAAAFASVVGAQQPVTTPPLIGDLWTRDTLAAALGTTTGLAGLNGHADHHRLQPAAGGDLFTAANLPASLERAVVFSMGCHSGLSASDASVGGAIAADWAQAFAGKGTAAFAGNLGYGYGDTITVAYSEALNVRLAQGLRDGLPIGEALVEAKQAYLADLGLVGVYDEKAMSELALYGLPMWGLEAPAGTTTAVSARRRHQALHRHRSGHRPPRRPLPLAADAGPHQRLLRQPLGRPERRAGHAPAAAAAEGGSSTSPTTRTACSSPAWSRATSRRSTPCSHGRSSTARPRSPSCRSPTSPSPPRSRRLVSQRTRTGRRVSAVLVHGQFFSDDIVDADGKGHQRLFTRVDLSVLRSAGTDRLAPRFDAIEAAVLSGASQVSFSVDAVDLPAGTSIGVTRVLVAFRDETSPTWRFLDLQRGADGTWGGGAPVGGTRVEYFVQAVDAAGNVAVSTNKGILFEGAPPPAPSGTGVEPSLDGAQTAGWFTPEAVLDIDAADGVAVDVSIDGGAFAPFSAPLTITDDGLHTVHVRGSNGYEATLLAPVDSLAPTAALDRPGATVPLNGRVPLEFRCGDTASGVASCAATVDGVARPAGFEVPAVPGRLEPHRAADRDRPRRARHDSDVHVHGRQPRDRLREHRHRPRRHLRPARRRRALDDADAADRDLGPGERPGLVAGLAPDRLHEVSRRYVADLPDGRRRHRRGPPAHRSRQRTGSRVVARRQPHRVRLDPFRQLRRLGRQPRRVGPQEAHDRLEARPGAELVAAGHEPDRVGQRLAPRARHLEDEAGRDEQDPPDDDSKPRCRDLVALRRHDRLRAPHVGLPFRDLDDDVGGHVADADRRDRPVRPAALVAPGRQARVRLGHRRRSRLRPVPRNEERDELGPRSRHQRVRKRLDAERLSRRAPLAKQRDQDGPPARAVELAEEDALPRAEREPPVAERHEHLRAHQRRSDVRGRVLLALLDVLPAPRCRRPCARARPRSRARPPGRRAR